MLSTDCPDIDMGPPAVIAWYHHLVVSNRHHTPYSTYLHIQCRLRWYRKLWAIVTHWGRLYLYLLGFSTDSFLFYCQLPPELFSWWPPGNNDYLGCLCHAVIHNPFIYKLLHGKMVWHILHRNGDLGIGPCICSGIPLCGWEESKIPVAAIGWLISSKCR